MTHRAHVHRLAIAAAALLASGLGACASSSARTPVADSKEDLVLLAAVADMGEIEEGQLALLHSANPAVRGLAAQLVSEHATSLQAHQPILRKMKVDLDDMREASTRNPELARLLNDHQRTMMRLHMLVGSDFDKAYATRQVAVHDMVLTTLRTLAGAPNVPGGSGQGVNVQVSQTTLTAGTTGSANGMTGAGDGAMSGDTREVVISTETITEPALVAGQLRGMAAMDISGMDAPTLRDHLAAILTMHKQRAQLVAAAVSQR